MELSPPPQNHTVLYYTDATNAILFSVGSIMSSHASIADEAFGLGPRAPHPMPFWISAKTMH